MKLKTLSILLVVLFFFSQASLARTLYFKFLDNPNVEVPVSVDELTVEHLKRRIRAEKKLPAEWPIRIIFAGKAIDTDAKLQLHVNTYGFGVSDEPFHVIYNVDVGG